MAQDLPAPPPLANIIQDAPPALFLDFDGTLVDLATTPEGIDVADDLGDRLEKLAQRLHGRLAVVSGRALDNLLHHIGQLEVARAGSHGADQRLADGTVLSHAAEALPDDVVAQIADYAVRTGLHYERKAHGAALHSRGNPNVEDNAAHFMAQLAEDYDLTLKRGKFVAELVRPGADKGAAVRAFMAIQPFAGSRPLFLGDDVTDEDGFIAARELGGLAIAVGPRRSENADYALADPAAVHHWLGL
ncbi:MAG: trehalose-phosphatase [Sphingomonadaceae bacterium]